MSDVQFHCVAFCCVLLLTVSCCNQQTEFYNSFVNCFTTILYSFYTISKLQNQLFKTSCILVTWWIKTKLLWTSVCWLQRLTVSKKTQQNATKCNRALFFFLSAEICKITKLYTRNSKHQRREYSCKLGAPIFR